MLISQQTLVAVILGDRKIIKCSIGYAAEFLCCCCLGREGAGKKLVSISLEAMVYLVYTYNGQISICTEPASNLIRVKAHRLSYAGVRLAESSHLVIWWLLLVLCEQVHQGKVQVKT